MNIWQNLTNWYNSVPWWEIGIITAIIFGIVIIYIWNTYNRLVNLRNRVQTDFSDIDVYVHRRASLIQNLVDVVRDYASHENKTFKQVAQARSALKESKNTKDSAAADNMLTETLRSLMMVVEDNPDLQASENYQQLRGDMREVEDQIAIYRENYNSTAEIYNNAIETFPNLIVAKQFGFKRATLFQPSDTEIFKVDVKETS